MAIEVVPSGQACGATVTGVDGTRFVLRRPPTGEVLATAHDMAREHRIISGVGKTSVPVPQALGLCEDDAVIGYGSTGLLPQAIAIAKDHLPPAIGEMPGLEPGLFGVIMVLFIIFEPMGLYGRWVKLKLFFQMFPLYRKATFKRQKTYLKTERVQ